MVPHQPFDSASCKFLAFDGDEVWLVFYTAQQYYGIPGGRVDAGETLYQALQREAQEEFGVGVKDAQPFDAYIVYNDPIRGGQTCLVLFYEATLAGEPRKTLSSNGEKVAKIPVAHVDSI